MPRRILILLVVLMLLAASAGARTFGKGDYVSFEFPPQRPTNPPAEINTSLDDNWQFVRYLYDADTSQSNYASFLNALPVGMAFTHRGRGFIATLHTVFKTTDGGANWQNLDPHPEPPEGNPSEFSPLRSPIFVSGLAARPLARDSVRYDTLYLSTTDGSADSGTVQLIYWQLEHHLYPFPQVRAGAWLTNIVMPDSFACYALAGLDGRLFGNDSLRNVFGWGEFNPDKILIRSSRQDTINFSDTWIGGVCSAGNLITAVGSHHWVSRDSGRYWQIRPAADSIFDNCVSFCDSLHGLTGGGMISPQFHGWVHETTDGGRNWSDRVLDTPGPIRCVQMVTPDIGFAAGGDYLHDLGRIWRTTDGGTTWNLDLQCTAEIKCLAVNRVTTAFVDVFAAGVFSDFRGGVWRTRVFAPDLSSAVVLANPDTLDFGSHAVGDQDTITTILSNIGTVTDTIFSVFAPQPFMRVWPHSDPVPIGPGEELSLPVIFSPTEARNYEGSIVLNTKLSGFIYLDCRGSVASSVSNPNAILPANTALSVSPNPGNATFEIRFDVPRTGAVKLAIFDINGRVVQNLAEEHLSAGSHVRLWNAADFASGTYFVRLDVLNDAVTRKVVLLK